MNRELARCMAIALSKFAIELVGDQYRKRSIADMRKTLKVASIEAEVAVARVRWFQYVLRLPAQYNQFAAALFGSPRCSGTPKISDEGKPLPTASPWLIAFWKTALEIARVTENG